MTGKILASTLLAALLSVSGCSDKAESPAPPQKGSAAATPSPQPPAPREPAPMVLDVFEVGATVYVRSLMVEAARNVMWVGTSVGVHEIDLKTKEALHTFTREHGLANEYVFGIGLDSENQVWFGTNAGGASRYNPKDGTWKTWFPMHGLADYWIYSFASHPDGGLWVGTWAGVNRIDIKTGKVDTFIKELVNEWVYAISVDSKKRVWFGTEGGISRFDGQNWNSWTHADGLGAANAGNLPVSINTGLGTRKRHDLGILTGGQPTYNPNYVFSMVITPDDTVWAGTWGGGVTRFDGQTWKNFTIADGLPGDIIYSLVQDQEGAIWAGTNNGVARYKNGAWRSPSSPNHMLGENIYALAVAPDGEIWAGAKSKVIRIGKEVPTGTGNQTERASK